MMVTAHPDDEDGGVLTLQARGHGVHAVLMHSLAAKAGRTNSAAAVRKLGVIRTLNCWSPTATPELSSASRASRTSVLEDAGRDISKLGRKRRAAGKMVRVIRTFRPDVLVARFSGTERDGHAHHQASALLTKEAFRAAGDPNRSRSKSKKACSRAA